MQRRMTGYAAQELIGQTPRLLHDEGVDQTTIERITAELHAGLAALARLVILRKDQTPVDVVCSFRHFPTARVAGRFTEGARAAFSHTRDLVGNDDVFDCAVRRAGMLRVDSIEALLTATETLARSRPIAGNRFAILTNGGGPGVLATDAHISRGGRLAELDTATIDALNRNRSQRGLESLSYSGGPNENRCHRGG